ncbi:hypothetical protein TrRE_jg2120, partial [Triparma retinervis]
HTVRVEGKGREEGGGRVRFKKGVDFGGRKWEGMGWYGALEMLRSKLSANKADDDDEFDFNDDW